MTPENIILQFIKQQSSNISIDTVLQYFQLYSNRLALNLLTPNKQQIIAAQQYKSQYYQYFHGISKYANITDYEKSQNLANHKIRILSDRQITDIGPIHIRPIINIKSIEREGAVVIYQIFISKFEMQITLLNFEKSAPSVDKKQSLGKGNHVQVRIQKCSNRAFAVKRCYFNKQNFKQESNMKANKSEIEEIIIQVAITKICSLYKIGPLVDTKIGFDLLCFNNCIEFHLQICLKSQSFQLNLQIDRVQKDLKRCLYILHSLKIIQRDIKPENILFSRLENRFIFSDFGISHPIIQPIGYKTHLKQKRGTVEYMLDQFKQMNSEGEINLYENDLQALKKTINKVIENIKLNKVMKETENENLKIFEISQIIRQPKYNEEYHMHDQNKEEYAMFGQNQFSLFERGSQRNNDHLINNYQQQQYHQKTSPFQYQGSASVIQINQIKQSNQNNPKIQKLSKKQQNKILQHKSQKQIVSRISQRSMMSHINYEFLKLKYDALRSTRKFNPTIQEVKLLTNQQLKQIVEIVYDSYDSKKINDMNDLVIKIKQLGNQQIRKVVQQVNSSNYNQNSDRLEVKNKYLIRIKDDGQKKKQQKIIKQQNSMKLNMNFINKIIKVIKNNYQSEIIDLFSDSQLLHFEQQSNSEFLKQIQQIKQIIQQQGDVKFKKKKRIITKQLQISPNQYKHKYNRYFQKIINQYQHNFQPSRQMLQLHRIRILQLNQYHKTLLSYTKPTLKIKYVQRQNIFVYNVIIAKFQLQIILFNFTYNAPFKTNFGKGCFGYIRLQHSIDHEFVVKRQYFKEQQFFQKQLNMPANKIQIQLAIIEYCIYKICSLYKIGPAIEASIGFDLLCFNDCIQFHLEICDTLNSEKIMQTLKQDNMKSLYNDIKACIYIMHNLKIIHKDIKPDNILFSKKYNKFVLSDFGLSHPISEQVGQKSQTYKQGTFHYMSNEMKRIQRRGLVNLYQNDIYGFKISLLEQYKRILENKKQKVYIQKKKQQIKQKKNDNIKAQSINYAYLKFKYFSCKLSAHLSAKSIQWQSLDQNQMNDIANIILQSTEINKIKQFYDFILQNQFQFKFKNLKNYMKAYKQKLEGRIKLNQQKQINSLEKLMVFIRVYGYNTYTKQLYENGKFKYQKIEQKIARQQQEQKKNKKLKQNQNLLGWQKMNRIIAKSFSIIKQEPHNNKQKYQLCMQLLKYLNVHHNKAILIQIINELDYQMTFIQRIDYIIEVIKENININGIQKQFQQIMKQNQTNKIPYLLTHLQDLATIYMQRASYDLALKYCFNNIQTIKLIYGEMHPSIVDAYNLIGRLYSNMRKYELALQYFFKSVQISKRLFGETNHKLFTSYSQIAITFTRSNKLKPSLQYFFKCLAIKKLTFMQDTSAIGIIYQQISDVYMHSGQFQLSLEYCLKQIQIFQKFQSNPQILLNSYAQAAKIYFYSHQYELALNYIHKSISISLENQMYPLLVNNYFQVGYIYYNKKNYQLALQYFFKTIQIQKSLSGQVHDIVASAYFQIALCYNFLFQYNLSIKFQMKAITIFKQLYGENYITLSSSYHQCAILYIQLKEYELALEYGFKFLSIYKQKYGEMQLSVATCYDIISNIYTLQNKFMLALCYCLKSTFIRFKNEVQILPNFQKLSSLYIRTKNYIQAKRIQFNSLILLLNANPINYSQVIVKLTSIVQICINQNRLIEAHFYFQLVHKIRTRLSLTDVEWVGNSLSKLQEIRKQLPQFIDNYKCDQQFVKNVELKYSKLKYKELVLLLTIKKRMLEAEIFCVKKLKDRLKLTIEIWLCYKYMHCKIQIKRYIKKIQQIVNKLKSKKQKQLYSKILDQFL